MILAAALLALSQATIPPAHSVSNSGAVGAVLWQGLREGMNADEAAAAILLVPGVRAAKVKVKRGRGSVSVSTASSGVVVGDWKFIPALEFNTRGLSAVTLKDSGCLSTIVERLKLTGPTLKEKYGHFSHVKVVDDKGVQIGEELAFWNASTSVRISWTFQNPVGDAANNVLGQIAAGIAFSSCPNDNGQRMEATFRYAPTRDFDAERARYKNDQSETQKKMKEGF